MERCTLHCHSRSLSVVAMSYMYLSLLVLHVIPGCLAWPLCVNSLFCGHFNAVKFAAYGTPQMKLLLQRVTPSLPSLPSSLPPFPSLPPSLPLCLPPLPPSLPSPSLSPSLPPPHTRRRNGTRCLVLQFLPKLQCHLAHSKITKRHLQRTVFVLMFV